MAPIFSTQNNLWERLSHRKSCKHSSTAQHAQNSSSSSAAHNSSQAPADDPKFTLFPDLPTELRQKIWSFNHPTSGETINIALVTVPATLVTNGSKYDLPIQKYDGYQKLPTNFHACAASRRYTVERLGYKYCFGENFTHPIWFRPGVDGLHFESVAVVMELKYFRWSGESLRIFERVGRVSVGGLVHYGYSAEDYGLTLFKNLKTFTIQHTEYPGSLLETNLILNFKWDWVRLRLTATHPARRPFNYPDSIFGDRVQDVGVDEDAETKLMGMGTGRGKWTKEDVSDEMKGEIIEMMNDEIPEVVFMGRKEMAELGMGWVHS